MSAAKILLLVVFSAACVSAQEEPQSSPSQPAAAADALPSPPGSPRRCFAVLGEKALRIDVLPGRGWDNLRNLERSPVLAYNYTRCQTTFDGTYLIPDHVSAIPVLQSKVDTFTQLFDQASSYRSVTSAAVNADITVYSFISGQFSAEHEAFKQRVATQSAVQSRVELRHLRYQVHSDPSASLNEAFRHRILQIAASIQGNRTLTATYLSQLLVRDYGTHYIHTTYVGAVLTKKDYLSRSSVENMVGSSFSVSAGAQADFFGKVQLGFEVSFGNEEAQSDAYREAIQSTSIETYGGPLYTTNMTVQEWEAGVEAGMVAIDRDGDPIHFLINPDSLPDVPPAITIAVSSYVKAAVDKYYSVNTHRGCTDASSPNFDFFANIDDGSCTATSENVTFGGVYQTCRVIRGEQVCPRLEQRNPLTQDYSCPSGFEAVRLLTARETYTTSRPSCTTTYRACGFLWLSRCSSGTNCQTQVITSVAEFQTYWCAAKDKQVQGAKYYFGGIYSTSTPNPVTHTHGCPNSFTSLKFTSKGFICVTGDNELGKPQSLPFAGFHSCDAGNPFARREGQDAAPRECPSGYSQHLALVDDDCAINYCLRAGTLSNLLRNPIVLPPFIDLPESFLNETRNYYILDSHGNLWTNFDNSESWNIISPNSPGYFAALQQVNNSALFSPAPSSSTEEEPNPLDNPLYAALIGLGGGVLFVSGLVLLFCLFACCIRWSKRKCQSRKRNNDVMYSNENELLSRSDGHSVPNSCYARLEEAGSKDDTLVGPEIRRR